MHALYHLYLCVFWWPWLFENWLLSSELEQSFKLLKKDAVPLLRRNSIHEVMGMPLPFQKPRFINIVELTNSNHIDIAIIKSRPKYTRTSQSSFRIPHFLCSCLRVLFSKTSLVLSTSMSARIRSIFSTLILSIFVLLSVPMLDELLMIKNFNAMINLFFISICFLSVTPMVFDGLTTAHLDRSNRQEKRRKFSLCVRMIGRKSYSLGLTFTCFTCRVFRIVVARWSTKSLPFFSIIMDSLIAQIREVFQDDHINTEDVKRVLESYKSNPLDWQKYAHFDPHK